MKKKRILILGGSKDQIPMIQLAKQNNLYTIVADYNPNAPGFQYADHYYLASIRDVSQVEEIAIKEKVDGITSLITEAGVLAIFQVCQKIKLPNSYSLFSAEATTQKGRMREILQENNLNDLPFCMPKELAEAIHFGKQTGYPLVLKSSDSGGQNGLFKVQDQKELERCFPLSQIDSFKQKIILEKFVAGPEINVVYTVYNNKVKDLIISDRIKDKEAFGIVKRHRFPSIYNEEIYPKVKARCQAITDALHISNAVVFPQFIYDLEQKEVYLLEIGVRIPGGIMDQLMEKATGLKLNQFNLDIALGSLKEYESYRKNKPEAAVMVTFFNAQPGPLKCGKIKTTTGIEQARHIPGVANLDYFFQSGTNLEITPLKKGKDRFFYTVTVGKDLASCHQAVKKVFHSIQFLDENQNSLISQNFGFDKFYLQHV